MYTAYEEVNYGKHDRLRITIGKFVNKYTIPLEQIINKVIREIYTKGTNIISDEPIFKETYEYYYSFLNTNGKITNNNTFAADIDDLAISILGVCHIANHMTYDFADVKDYYKEEVKFNRWATYWGNIFQGIFTQNLEQCDILINTPYYSCFLDGNNYDSNMISECLWHDKIVQLTGVRRDMILNAPPFKRLAGDEHLGSTFNTRKHIDLRSYKRNKVLTQMQWEVINHACQLFHAAEEDSIEIIINIPSEMDKLVVFKGLNINTAMERIKVELCDSYI